MVKQDMAKGLIFQVAGKDTFFEVFSDSFNIGKVKLKFTATGKTSIDCYWSFPDALAIAKLILTRSMNLNNPSNMLVEQIQNAGNYGIDLYVGGGTDKSGNVVARSLKAQVSQNPNKFMMVLSCSKGAGKKNNNGGISFIGKPDTSIMVPLTFRDAYALAEVIKLHVETAIHKQHMGGEWPYTPVYNENNQQGGYGNGNNRGGSQPQQNQYQTPYQNNGGENFQNNNNGNYPQGQGGYQSQNPQNHVYSDPNAFAGYPYP